MKGSEYVEGPHNFCQDAAYGVFISDEDTIDGELPQYQITETISFLKNRRYEDGWYMVHTALSKGSIQFEFEPAGGSFDINELVVQLKRVDLSQLSDDLYGELNFTVLSDFQYQGESINEYYDAELVDRGLDRVVHIVEIKDGEFNLVSYEDILSDTAHIALVKGNIDNNQSTFVRVHIQNTIKDILHSSHHSGWPLKNAMQRINKEGNGVILILRWSESVNAIIKDIDKIKNTNEDLSQDFDRRTLGVGGQILSDLGVTKMKLLSSPKTFYGLGGYGLEIEKYITE